MVKLECRGKTGSVLSVLKAVLASFYHMISNMFVLSLQSDS